MLLTKEMIAAFSVVLLCAIGFSALLLGYFLSWLLHRPWSGWTAVADAATAVGTTVLCAVLMAVLRREASSEPIRIFGLPLLSVLCRHLAKSLVARVSAETAA